ncbi:MAG: DUF4007 family protein [Nitrospirota bacterium]
MSLEASSTFGFEKAWFVKALKKISEDETIFLKSRTKEAQIYFSIGSKKVEALHKWLIGAGLAEGSRTRTQISKIGGIISHYDPGLYEYGTWFVILYNLGSYPHTPEIVYWYLNEFKTLEFTLSDLKAALHQYGDFGKSYVDNAWQALKNTFSYNSSTPFGEEFRLFEEVDSKNGIYRKRYPQKEYIHPLIFAYCIVDWTKRNKKETVIIADIASAKGLPGRLLNLPERITEELLTDIDIKYRKRVFDVDRKAGLNRISIFIKEPDKLLHGYYEEVIKNCGPEEVISILTS